MERKCTSCKLIVPEEPLKKARLGDLLEQNMTSHYLMISFGDFRTDTEPKKTVKLEC